MQVERCIYSAAEGHYARLLVDGEIVRESGPIEDRDEAAVVLDQIERDYYEALT